VWQPFLTQTHQVYEFVVSDHERRTKQRAAAPSLRKADAVREENDRRIRAEPEPSPTEPPKPGWRKY
jgi:hypothetical protein